ELQSLLQCYHEGLQDGVLLLPQLAQEGSRSATHQITCCPLSPSRTIPPVPRALLLQPVEKHRGRYTRHPDAFPDQAAIAFAQQCLGGLVPHTGKLMDNQRVVALG